MPRVQVNDLPNPERFRPVQPTGDTFAGAPKPVQDDNLTRLSSALASFGSTVTGLSGRSNRVTSQDIQAQFERDRQLHGNDQAFANYQRGAAQAPPDVQIAVNNTAGADAARTWAERERVSLADGTYPLFDNEGRPTDIQAIHAQRVGEHYRTLPPHLQLTPGRPNLPAAAYQRGFADSVDKVREAAITDQRERLAADNNQQINSVITRFLDPVAQAAGRTDVTDAQLVELWNKQKQELRGWSRNLLDYRRMDDRMVGTLSDLAQTNPAAALRLINLDRGNSPEGAPLGTIRNSPFHGERLNDIERTARTNAATRYDQRMVDQASEAGARALAEGRGFEVQQLQNGSYQNPYDTNPATATRQLSASTVRDAAYSRWQTGLAQSISQQGGTPEAQAEGIYQAQRRAFVDANVPNPVWRNEFNRTTRIIADPAAVTQPENMAHVRTNIRMYERISREAPGYLRTLGINEDGEKFFQRVQVYRDLLGQGEDRAIQSAAASMQAPAPQLDGVARERINREAQNLGSSRLRWTSAGGNVMEGRRAIAQLAETYMIDAAVKPEDAVKKAAEVLNERAVVLNGRGFIADPNVSRETLPFWQSRLQQEVQRVGGVATSEGLVSDASQLSVRRINNGAGYYVVDRNGVPVQAAVTQPGQTEPTLRPMVIDPQSVRTSQLEDQRQRDAMARAEGERLREIRNIQTQLFDHTDNQKQGGNRAKVLAPERVTALQERLNFLDPRPPAPANPDASPDQTAAEMNPTLGQGPDLGALWNRLVRPEEERRSAQEGSRRVLERLNPRRRRE